MRTIPMVFFLSLIGCTTTRPLLESDFRSSADFEARLAARWSMERIRAYCKPEYRIDPTIQAPVALMSCNRHGVLYPDQPTGFDRIEWDALVIKGRVRGISLIANRGTES